MLAGLGRATSKHTSPSHSFLPKHGAAHLEQGLVLFPAAAAAQLGLLALLQPAACLVLGFMLFGDKLYIVKAPAALEMQCRPQAGHREVFNRRAAGFEDVIGESSRQDKEIKALWSQGDGLLCVYRSAFREKKSFL